MCIYVCWPNIFAHTLIKIYVEKKNESEQKKVLNVLEFEEFVKRKKDIGKFFEIS